MKEQLKNTLFDLIKIKSVGTNLGEIKKVADYVETRLKDAPLVKRWEHGGKHAVFVSLNSNTSLKVLFVGHLDVVDAEEEQFVPKLEGDRILGRGALDMKGPDAVMIELADKLIKEGRNLDLGFLFTTDEEVGSEDGVAYVLKNGFINAEFAVIPDGGGDFNLVIASKGVLHVKITCHGKATHGSRVWEGENAIEKCIDVFEKIKHSGLFPKEPCNIEEHWHNTINLGKLTGGDSVNRVPDHAEMFLDIRFVAPLTVEKTKEEIKKYLPSDADFEVISYGEPVETPTDNPYLLRVKDSIKEVLHKDVRFIKEHGATDARFFAEKGIHSVILYPIGGNIHGKGEWVSLSSLETLFYIFETFVKKALK